MIDAVVQAGLALLAIVAGWGLRWLASQRRWASARRIARAELDSPDPECTNDPETAMAKAVVSVNRSRIRSESRALEAPSELPSIPRTRTGNMHDGNGHGHKTPRHGVRHNPDKE